MKATLLCATLGIGLVVSWAAVQLVGLQRPPRSISRQRSTSPAYRQREMQLKQLHDDAYVALNSDKDLPKAERLFRQILNLDQSDPYAWVSLARMMDTQGRDQEALALYDSLLQPHPSSGSSLERDRAVLMRYAELCEQFGRTNDAIQAYQKILATGTGDNESNWISDPNMRVSLDTSDWRDARAHAHILTGIAYQQRLEGLFYSDAEMAERALKEYHEAVRLRPNMPIAHYYLGVGLKGARREQEAQAAFARADQLGDADFRTAMHKRENEEKHRLAEQRKTFREVTVSYAGPGKPPIVTSRPLSAKWEQWYKDRDAKKSSQPTSQATTAERK